MVKIEVKGPIIENEDKWIYRWFGMDATCPKDVNDALKKANGDEVLVEINSGGGSVFAGSEIYTAIWSYKGNVKIHCVGLAGSAASVIMAARESEISPTAMVMIHNTSGGARGDYHDMDKKSEILQKANQSIVNAYALKTGLEKQELLDLMDKETWMTAEEAVSYGFCDRIMEGNQNNQASLYRNPAVFNSCEMLDKKIIDKIRSEIGSSEGKSASPIPLSNTEEGHFSIINNTQKKEETMENEITTVGQLTAEYPALVQKIIDSAKEEAITNERGRLKAIDEIAGTLTDDIVNEAKYENPITAETLALQALKANKAIGNKALQDMVDDIENSGVNDVKPQANSGLQNGEEEQQVESNAKVNNLAAKLKKRREE